MITTLPLPEFLLRRAINDYPIGLQGFHEPSATIAHSTIQSDGRLGNKITKFPRRMSTSAAPIADGSPRQFTQLNSAGLFQAGD